MRKITHKTQKDFADYLNIPSADIRNWEQGFRTPPQYVLDMIERILKMEKYIIDTTKTYYTEDNHIPYSLVMKENGQYDTIFVYDGKKIKMDSPYFCHNPKATNAFIIGCGFEVENMIAKIQFEKMFGGKECNDCSVNA